MPRGGPPSYTYSLPAIYLAVPGTLIVAAQHNTPLEDIAATLNAAWPINLGGTGGTSKQGAISSLFDGTTTVDDDNFIVAYNLDGSKRFRFDASGLPIGTTEVIIPDGGQLGTVVGELRNRMVNGDKLVSQENGQTSGTTNGRYISDQNAMFFVSSAGTFTGVNVTGRTSPAGGNRDSITITTPDGSLAAGEYLTYTQNLEGSNVGDLQWGTANAKPLVVRRGFNYPAGTWPVAFHNSAANRSYVTTFTVSSDEAGTDIVREFSIPGDTTGTWLTADGVIGITMDAVLGAGSTFQGVSGWQPGNILTVSGATNGMALSGAVFQFFDEGLKLDPDATGVYGQYEVAEVDPVYKTERYWEVFTVANTGQFSSTIAIGSLTFRTVKCKSTYSLSAAIAGVLQGNGAAQAVTGFALSSQSVNDFQIDFSTAGGLSAGGYAWRNGNIRINARLS